MSETMASNGLPEAYTGAKKKQKPETKEKKKRAESGEEKTEIHPGQKKNDQSHEWLTQEDVERDMWICSEFFQKPDFKAAPSKSILEWRNRKGENDTKSIFDQDIPEEREYFISGRGRGVPHKLVRPGEPVYATKNDTEEIIKKIREVSGMGYRNEVIEQQFANKALADIIGESEYVDYETLPEFACHISQSTKSTSEPSSSSQQAPSEGPSLRSSPSSSSCHSGELVKSTSPKVEFIDIDSSDDFPPLK